MQTSKFINKQIDNNIIQLPEDTKLEVQFSTNNQYNIYQYIIVEVLLKQILRYMFLMAYKELKKSS